jgi:hypothetical protein
VVSIHTIHFNLIISCVKISLTSQYIYWHCILKEGCSFTKIWTWISPTDVFESAACHFTYLEELFHQTWRNLGIHVVIMYYSSFKDIWSFLPFLRPLLLKGHDILIGKYNYHNKNSFLKPILAWGLKT